jgi:C-terminal processing protease CtpA/Prc
MIPHETCERILTKVQETVQAGYYAPDFHGKHWNEIVASHRQAIFDAKTTEDFEREMNAMLVDLDSNMRLLGPNSKITARNAINASFHAVDLRGDGGRRWVFQDVAPGGVAQRSGVLPADVLLTIDGAPTAPPHRPAFEMDRAMRVEVLRGNERKQIDLDLKTPAPKYKDNPYSEPSVTETMTPDRIAIVTISLFPGKIGIDFANALSHLFRDRLAGAEGLGTRSSRKSWRRDWQLTTHESVHTASAARRLQPGSGDSREWHSERASPATRKDPIAKMGAHPSGAKTGHKEVCCP